MTKLVVFDWNGTLLADARMVYASNRATCLHFGKPDFSFARYQEAYTIPIVDIYTSLGFGLDEYSRCAPEITTIFHDTYEALASRARLRKGARRLLGALKNAGIPVVLLSNHTQVGIATQLRRLGIDTMIDDVIAAGQRDEAGRQLTKGCKLAEYLQRHGWDTREVAIVGDTVEEVEIGKELGVTTIALTGGLHSSRRLRTAHPDFVVHSLDQIFPQLG